MIDKYQKGYIKDLIISGDSNFQTILEKYEKGDKKELEGNIQCCLSNFQFNKLYFITLYNIYYQT